MPREDDEEDGDLLTVQEAADRLRLSTATIRRMCNEGTFKGAFTAGERAWRIPRASVKAYIDERQAEAGNR